VVDLRSDTLTQPTPEMRRAIADAEVGDEQKREDPTVIALEERAAELLGHEEAIFLPTATMANQIALRTLTEPGDEVIAEEMAHVFRYELGGPAVHSGLVMKSLVTQNGIFTAEDVREAVNPPGDLHTAPTRLVCIENTHNGGGGRVWPLGHLQEVVAEARAHGLSVHLDGARLMNAAVASGTPAAEYGREFDTVTLCLSKGLGCPLGAVADPEARCARPGRGRRRRLCARPQRRPLRRIRQRPPACGGWRNACVELDQVETNFVQLDAARLGLSADEAVGSARRRSASFAARKDVLRALRTSTSRPTTSTRGSPTAAFSGSSAPSAAGGAPVLRRAASSAKGAELTW
jgi:hypothetical protein